MSFFKNGFIESVTQKDVFQLYIKAQIENS